MSGVISGRSFVGYCIAIIAAATLTERFGARSVAVSAAVVAAIGMAGIALAGSPYVLTMAVIVAGSSTGLASPPIAAAVAAAVRADRQDATNTIINAGTSAGVAQSGPMALLMGGEWRTTFAVFAVLAVMLAIATGFALSPTRDRRPALGLPKITKLLRRLIAAAFLAGMASTAVGRSAVSLSRKAWTGARPEPRCCGPASVSAALPGRGREASRPASACGPSTSDSA